LLVRDTNARVNSAKIACPFNPSLGLTADLLPRSSRDFHPSFPHLRPVTTITDTIPTPCENHSQIAAAKRVPVSRGGQVFFDISIPRAGLDKLIGTKPGSNNKK
jgi:hypothetical protein